MPSFRMLLLLVGICIVVSVALGFSIGSSTPSTVGDGSLNQSPLIYVLLIIFLLAIGFFFSRMYNRVSSEGSFSFAGFLNVGLAGVIIGGMIHELMHMILLQHPTQFQVHFGDPVAVFSTCCLAPGELPNEEIAYGVQMLVMLLWFFFNRGLIVKKEKELISSASNPVKKINEKTTHADVHSDGLEKEKWTEHSLEKEWEKNRAEINEAFSRLDKEDE